MINAFYGIKLGQSQTFTEDGVRIPVTEVLAEPLTVIQVKNVDTDGYVALKVGFGERKAKNIKKPVLGQLKKITNYELRITNKDKNDLKQSGVETHRVGGFNDQKQIAVDVKEETTKKDLAIEQPASPVGGSNNRTMYPRYIREIRVKDNEVIKNVKVGNKINIADVFKEGDNVHVSGVSIGKGYQGVVKRHHFQGGPRTHGQSDRERAPGSIGQTTTPGRVYKGKRMAGKMGGEAATIKNLKVARFDVTRNVVLIKGLVPGKRKGVVKLYR